MNFYQGGRWVGRVVSASRLRHTCKGDEQRNRGQSWYAAGGPGTNSAMADRIGSVLVCGGRYSSSNGWNTFHGRPIVVEVGQQTRDIAYIDDVVVEWLLAIAALEEKVDGRKFQVSYGEERAIIELAGMCCAVSGCDVPIDCVDCRPGEEGQREAFSIERAGRELGLRSPGPAGRSPRPNCPVGASSGATRATPNGAGPRPATAASRPGSPASPLCTPAVGTASRLRPPGWRRG